MKKRRNCTCPSRGWLFIAPSFLGVAVFVLLPFVDVIRRSFVTGNGNFAGLANYAEVLASGAFRLAAANTLKFAMLCIPALVLVSLLIAMAVRRAPAGANACKTAFLLPMAVPAASVALIWRLFFHENGLINGLLLQLGGQAVMFMESGAAFYVLMISYLWKNIGYDMVLWSAGLANIPESLHQAAAIDGAGAFARFRYITAPQLTSVLFTIFVLSLLNSFKVFREAYLVAGDYPHTSMYMLQHLFNNWFTNLEMGKLCAGAVLTALVILSLILVLQKTWGRDDE